MRTSAFAIITSAAVAVVLSAASYAQKRENTARENTAREITANEVKDFFAQVQREAADFVQKGDIDGIRQWTDRNVADDARFKVMIEVMNENTPKMWSVIDLAKADAEQLQAELGQAVVQSIQDYSLRIEVNKVISHGADAATVATTWSDSGKLMPPATRTSGQAQSTRGQAAQTGTQPPRTGGTQARMLDVKRNFECDQLLVREEGRLKIGLSSCRGQVHL